MNSFTLIKDTVIGFHHNYKKGEIVYYLPSVYKDSFQEWSIAIYRKKEDGSYFLSGQIRTSCLDNAKQENNIKEKGLFDTKT